MIAVMLIAIVVTSVFSLVVTAQVGTKKTGLRGQAVFHARQLQEQLRDFVTADLAMPGPNGSGGPASWKHPNDSYGGWALQAGVTHNVSSMLGPELAAAGAQLTYTVFDVGAPCGGGGANGSCKDVRIMISWTSPSE